MRNSLLKKLQPQRPVTAAATQRVSAARHCCINVPVIDRDQLVLGGVPAAAPALALACQQQSIWAPVSPGVHAPDHLQGTCTGKERYLFVQVAYAIICNVR